MPDRIDGIVNEITIVANAQHATGDVTAGTELLASIVGVYGRTDVQTAVDRIKARRAAETAGR